MVMLAAVVLLLIPFIGDCSEYSANMDKYGPFAVQARNHLENARQLLKIDEYYIRLKYANPFIVVLYDLDDMIEKGPESVTREKFKNLFRLFKNAVERIAEHQNPLPPGAAKYIGQALGELASAALLRQPSIGDRVQRYNSVINQEMAVKSKLFAMSDFANFLYDSL